MLPLVFLIIWLQTIVCSLLPHALHYRKQSEVFNSPTGHAPSGAPSTTQSPALPLSPPSAPPVPPATADLSIGKWQTVHISQHSSEVVLKLTLTDELDTELFLLHMDWTGTADLVSEVRLVQRTVRHVNGTDNPTYWSVDAMHKEENTMGATGSFRNIYFEVDDVGGDLLVLFDAVSKDVSVNVGITTESDLDSVYQTKANGLFFFRVKSAYTFLGSLNFLWLGGKEDNPTCGTTVGGKYHQLPADMPSQSWSDTSVCIDSHNLNVGFIFTLWNTEQRAKITTFTVGYKEYKQPNPTEMATDSIRSQGRIDGYTAGVVLSHTIKSITVQPVQPGKKNRNGYVELYYYMSCEDYEQYNTPPPAYIQPVSPHWPMQSFDVPDIGLHGAILVLRSPWDQKEQTIDYNIWSWGSTIQDACRNCTLGTCVNKPPDGHPTCTCYNGFQSTPCDAPADGAGWNKLVQTKTAGLEFSGQLEFTYNTPLAGLYLPKYTTQLKGYKYVVISFEDATPATHPNYYIVPSVGGATTYYQSIVSMIAAGGTAVVCADLIYTNGLYIGTHYDGAAPPPATPPEKYFATMTGHGNANDPTMVYLEPVVLGAPTDVTTVEIGNNINPTTKKIIPELWTVCVNNKFSSGTNFQVVVRVCDAIAPGELEMEALELLTECTAAYGLNIWHCTGNTADLQGASTFTFKTTATKPMTVAVQLIDNGPTTPYPSPMPVNFPQPIGTVVSIIPNYHLFNESVIYDATFAWFVQKQNPPTKNGTQIAVWDTYCGLNVAPEPYSTSKFLSAMLGRGVYNIGGYMQYKRYSSVLQAIDPNWYYWEFSPALNVQLTPTMAKNHSLALNKLISVPVSIEFADTSTNVTFKPTTDECNAINACVFFIQLDMADSTMNKGVEYMVNVNPSYTLANWMWVHNPLHPMDGSALRSLPAMLANQTYSWSLTPGHGHAGGNGHVYTQAFTIKVGIAKVLTNSDQLEGIPYVTDQFIVATPVNARGSVRRGSAIGYEAEYAQINCTGVPSCPPAIGSIFIVNLDQHGQLTFSPDTTTTSYSAVTLSHLASTPFTSRCLAAEGAVSIFTFPGATTGVGVPAAISITFQQLLVPQHGGSSLEPTRTAVYYRDAIDTPIYIDVPHGINQKDAHGNLVQVEALHSCTAGGGPFQPLSSRYGFKTLVYTTRARWVRVTTYTSPPWSWVSTKAQPCTEDHKEDDPNYQCYMAQDQQTKQFHAKGECRHGWHTKDGWCVLDKPCEYSNQHSCYVPRMMLGTECTVQWNYATDFNPICYVHVPETADTTRYLVSFRSDNPDTVGFMGTDHAADSTILTESNAGVLNFTSERPEVELCGVDMELHDFYFTIVNAASPDVVHGTAGFTVTKSRWNSLVDLVSTVTPRSFFLHADTASARVSVCIPHEIVDVTHNQVLYPYVIIESCKVNGVSKGLPTAFTLQEAVGTNNEVGRAFEIRDRQFRRLDYNIFSNHYDGHAEVRVFTRPSFAWPRPTDPPQPFTVNFVNDTSVSISVKAAAASFPVGATFTVFKFDNETHGYSLQVACGIQFLADTAGVQGIVIPAATLDITLSGLQLTSSYVFAVIVSYKQAKTALVPQTPKREKTNKSILPIAMSAVSGFLLLIVVCACVAYMQHKRRILERQSLL